MAKEENKTEYFFNAGADDYSPLLYVVFLVAGVTFLIYAGIEIFQAKEFVDGQHVYKCKSGYVLDANTKECVDRYPALLVK